LYEEANNEIHHHRRVDAHREVAQIVTDHRRNEVVKTSFGEISVEEVERKGHSESEGQGKDNPLIGLTDAEEVFR
jgi:hypothetical protein